MRLCGLGPAQTDPQVEPLLLNDHNIGHRHQRRHPLTEKSLSTLPSLARLLAWHDPYLFDFRPLVGHHQVAISPRTLYLDQRTLVSMCWPFAQRFDHAKVSGSQAVKPKRCTQRLLLMPLVCGPSVLQQVSHGADRQVTQPLG